MALATETLPPAAPKAKVNRLGLEQSVYRGGKTTLCAGCGHNAISEPACRQWPPAPRWPIASCSFWA
jgi:hypothetical protein